MGPLGGEASRRLENWADGNSMMDNVTEVEEGYGKAEPEDSMTFLFTSIVVGTGLVQLSTVPRFQFLQQTVMLFILGMAYSLALDLTRLRDLTGGFLGVSHRMWMNISPHLLLAVMLPLLITGDSISIDTSVAKHVANQCLYLAGPGVLMCAFGLALFFWIYIPYNWPFMLCLTMSSILAATDPVAVVSLLKELGASPALTVQIQGESLLNDGTAMVLFTVAYDLLSGESLTFTAIIIFLVKSAVVAILLGFGIGALSVVWIRLANDRLDDRSNIIQISITLCCAYWSWILGEGTFHVSGVLCTVSSALVLADKMWPSIVSKEAMHHVWHTFEHIGNSTIFFVAGSLTGHNMVQIPFMDYIHLLVIYFVCTMVRGVMLYCSLPVLNLMKHTCTEPVTMADATVMCWGGLRGALGLALAIKVAMGKADGNISDKDGQRVLFYVGGVALLTLIVNATTCPWLVKWLRLNRPNSTKQMMMLNIHRQMSDFASQQSVAKTAIGKHVKHMLVNVENAISSAVDQSTIDSHEQIKGPKKTAAPPAELPVCTSSSTLGGDQDNSDIVSDIGFGILGDRCRCFRRLFHRRTHGLAIVSSSTLAKRLETAKALFEKIPEPTFDLLGLATVESAGAELEEILRLLDEDGDSATPWQLKPINDVFLSLIRAKYWASIEADEFPQGEGQFLLDSISGAMGMSSYKLHDLHFMRRQVIRTFGDDEEVKRAVLMQKSEEVPNRIHGSELSSRDGSAAASKSKQQSQHSDIPSRVNGSELTKLEDDYSEQGDQANCSTSPVAYNIFSVVIISMSTAIGIYLSLATKPGEDLRFTIVENGVTQTCFTFFLLDLILRLVALKKAFLDSNWRRCDLALTVLCSAGTTLEVLRTVGVLGDEIMGSSVTQVIRAIMVMQLVRVHQLFRSVKTLRTLRKLATVATGNVPRCIPGRLQVISVLAALTRAHKQSQEELIKYFGRRGKVASGIVARCYVESVVEVLEASYIAWRLSLLVSPVILNSLHTLHTCVGVTQDIVRLVEECHHCGAMSEEDADSVLGHLKRHQYSLRSMVHDAHMGIIPDDFLAVDGPEHCDSVSSLDARQSEKGHRRSSELFVHVSTQTDPDWSMNRAESLEADEADPPEADPPLVDDPPPFRSAPAHRRVLEEVAEEDEKGSKESSCCNEYSQLEDTWSVYSVDDLVPPPSLPGPGLNAVVLSVGKASSRSRWSCKKK